MCVLCVCVCVYAIYQLSICKFVNPVFTICIPLSSLNTVAHFLIALMRASCETIEHSGSMSEEDPDSANN